MKSVIPMLVVVVFAAVLDEEATGQSDARAPNPWLLIADNLPPLPYDVEVAISVDRVRIETYDPLIGRITLTNRDNTPLKLKIREDGAPYSVASLVARGNESFFRHHQWLRNSGPSSREISLAPGESTTGEILILFGGPPTGSPFAEAGRFRIKFGCQPDGRFAPVYTNALVLTVSPDDRGNTAFLDELSELMYSHYGWERELVLRDNEDYIPGMEILKKIIGQQTPHLVDPEREPTHKSEAELVDALTDLLDQHPDSSYSGYIARFLGLVHIETFQREVSWRGAKTWGETKASPDLKEVTQLCQSAYDKALRYLTIANQADLWPRTTAAFNLARLHGLAEEWSKASGICDKLRTDYAEQGGAALADKIEGEVRKYQEKIARRKETK